jgi:hypothetical protein
MLMLGYGQDSRRGSAPPNALYGLMNDRFFYARNIYKEPNTFVVAVCSTVVEYFAWIPIALHCEQSDSRDTGECGAD